MVLKQKYQNVYRVIIQKMTLKSVITVGTVSIISAANNLESIIQVLQCTTVSVTVNMHISHYMVAIIES